MFCNISYSSKFSDTFSFPFNRYRKIVVWNPFPFQLCHFHNFKGAIFNVFMSIWHVQNGWLHRFKKYNSHMKKWDFQWWLGAHIVLIWKIHRDYFYWIHVHFTSIISKWTILQHILKIHMTSFFLLGYVMRICKLNKDERWKVKTVN